MIWRASVKLLLLSLLFWAGQPGAGAAQPWNPFLGDQPTQHAILGHVAGLGPVLGPNGEQAIVEYDAQGDEVDRTPYQPGMSILSVDAWNAEVAQWNAAVQAAGEGNSDQLDIETYRQSSADRSRTCYDLSAGAASSLPPVPDGVKWVLVKKVSQGLPVCSEYLLALSTLDPPDAPISGGSSLIVDGNRDVVATSAEGHTFAFESAYFEPQAGLCPENPSIPSPVLRNLVAYQACRSAQVAKIWAPIWGVPLDTTQGLAFVPAVSNENGFFRLDYTSHGFDDESGTWVWGEVLLDAFNPRFPSSRKFYLKRRATGAGTVRSANFAMDLVQASVVAVLLNPPDPPRAAQDPKRPPEIPVVDPDYQFDEFTEYEYLRPEFPGVEPGYSFENLPEVDFRHLGLVEQISAIDLQATDVYLYRVSDGKLIGARRGLTPSNLVGITADPLQFPRAETPSGCEDNACIGLVLLTRGPASRATAEDAASLGGTAPYQSAVISAGGSPNQVSLELEYLESEPAVDFLRPGDTVQVVAVNRVTGYLGSALGRLQNRASGQLGVVNEGGGFGLIIAMLPPNLRIQAKRTFDIEAGQTSGGPPREYVIGFEGASLNTDTIVEITTTWVDHDGKPLPSDLAGFTGRLASVMDDELEGEGDAADSVDGLGHFSIRPGTHTQVARVPVERVDVGHLYLHIDAAPSDETVDFENALIDRQPSFAVNEVCYGSGDNCFPKPQGDGSNPLEQRPAHFVPFLVPMFDEAATRAATVAQRQELQDAWNEGDTLPILEKVDPIYEWVYRPEFKFAVLDLDVKGTDIVTDDQGTRLVVDYTLVGGDDTQQLDPLGDNEFVFSLGYAELLATVLTDLASGQISQAEFEDIASLLAMTSGGQLDAQADALGAILSPEDYLVLQLYLQHDSANGLYEFAFGSDFNLFADARTLEVERVHRRARYEHHTGLPEVPAYTDTYEFLSFEIKNDSSIEVVAIDANGTESPLLAPANRPAGRYRFVVDYQQIADAGITPETSPSFELLVRTSFTDENGSPATHTIVYDGVIREREQGEVIGQTIVNDVAIADGSLRLEREDFRIKGAGPDLAFVRTYSSSNPTSGAIGPAWRHQLGHQLVPIEAGNASATSTQDAGIPQWVRYLKGGFIGTDETPPAGQEWIEVLVSGTRFRKFRSTWYAERGRHGTLAEDRGAPDTTDDDYFIYTAMDGTSYRYRVPSLIGDKPTLDEVPVTVGDAAVYRIGVPPILNCPFIENVVDITAPNQHKLVFNYSGDNEVPGVCGELVSVVEVDALAQEGRRVELTYGSVDLVDPVSQEDDGSARRLVSVGGPEGIALSFAYDGQGRLETATRATRTETYTYPSDNRDPYIASAAVDPGLGNPIQAYDYTYHSDAELTLAGTPYGDLLQPGQIVKSVTLPVDQNAQRSPVGFEYDFNLANERRVRDANGELATYRLDDVGRPNEIVGPGTRYTAMTWDLDSGYTDTRTERTSAGDRLTSFDYTFDAQGRLEQTVETGPNSKTRATVFDVRFNKPVSRTDRNGYFEEWAYNAFGNAEYYEDAEGNRYEFMYNEQRLLETRLAPGPGLGRTNATVLLYDQNGYVRTSQSSTGDVTTTFYDDRGLLREREDPRENSTLYGYDDLDNLLTVERPDVTRIPAARAIAQTERRFQTLQLFTWDALGRKLSETDHNELRLDYEYDGRGLVTRIYRPPVQGGDAERVFTYDPNGNLLTETDWKAVGTNEPSDATVHTYNALNQRETTTNRVDDVMEYAYDQVGNLLHTIDYAGVRTEYTYDLLDRPQTMIRTRGSEPVGEEVAWEYYFEDDPERNLKQMTVERGPLAGAEITSVKVNRRYQRILRTNSRGQEYQWVYNPDGTVDHEIDEEGLRTQRSYYDDGRVRYEDREGGGITLRTEFEYDPAGNVTVVVDPRGNRVKREYDEWNRMFQSDVIGDAGARFSTEILYDGEGNVLNMHDPEGRDRSTIRDALGRITRTIAGDNGVVDFRHDRNGNVVEQTEIIAGRPSSVVTKIDYDAEDRELCRTEAFGTPVVRTRCVEEYDGVGNPKRVKDFRNAETTYAYDVNHQLIQADMPGGDSVGWTYSQNGLLVMQQDALLRQTDFDYDEIGRLALTTDPAVDGVRDTEQRFYDEVGNLTRLVDRRGIETVYTYDDFYRLRQVERGAEVVATYGYDSAGNLRYEEDGNCDRIDHCYNARNLLTVSYVPNGDSAAGGGCQATGTDPSLDSCPAGAPPNTDRILRQYDGVGNLRILTNEAVQDTAFTYDGENRIRTQTFAGETTTFTYDEAGLIRTRQQPSGGTDTYVYDTLGRLREVRDGGLLTTTYGYDPNGNLTLASLPSGATTEYVYDPRNRAEFQIQDPGGLALTTQFTYDPNDNLETLTDANGQLITYGYDEKNRRASADYPAQPGAPFYEVQRITWDYDGNDNVTGVQTQKQGPSGAVTDVTSFGYDARDRLALATYRGRDVRYAYDGASQRIGVGTGPSIVEGGSNSTVYKYDARGRVTGVVTASGEASYGYTPDGRLDLMTRPNGVDTDYSYTPQNRVASIEHRLGVTRLAEYAYTYDPDGNRLSETATQVEGGALVQQTRQMAYDLANRLCAVAQGQGALTGVTLPNCNGAVGTLTGVEETRYAFNGYNRDRETVVVDGLVSSGKVYDYDTANRVQTVDLTDGGTTTLSTLSYGYDNNGNTLSVTDSTAPTETMGFVYNPRDQLVQVTRGPPGSEAILGRYDYDAQGQRIRTEALGALTEEIYDGIALLARYQGGSDDAFVHRGPNGELLGVEAPSTPMQWMHNDVLGSPIVQTDDVGAVVSSTRYGVFGDVAFREEPGAAQGPRFGFTGHQYDAGTELVYANARYYQPGLGRFLSRDPFAGVLSEPVTQTPYLYAAHSPAVYTDPSGAVLPLVVWGAVALGAEIGFLTDLVFQRTERALDGSDANFLEFFQEEYDFKRGAVNTAVGGVSGLVGGSLAVAGVGVRTAAGIGVVTDSVLDTGAQVTLGEVQADGAASAFATNLAANTFLLGAGAGAGKLLDKFRGGKSGAGSAPVGDARQTVREHPSGERASGRPSAAPNPAQQGQTRLLLANPETPVSRRLTAGSPAVATQATPGGARGQQLEFDFDGPGPGSQAGAARAQARSADLNASRRQWEAENGTTAVIRGRHRQTGEVVDFVASEAPRRPRQFGNLRPGEQFVEGVGHAEQTIIRERGGAYDFIEGGSSRNVCIGTCQPLVEEAGLQLGVPTFRGRADKTPFRQFWRRK